MENLGEIIKKRRILNNISLSDASKELNVSEKILENIETNNLDSHIDKVFILGHLRSYCAFLELNQNEIIDQFKKYHFSENDFRVDIEKPKFQYNFIYFNKLISFSLIILIFSTFYFLFIEVDKPSREYALIPDLPENYISIVENENLKQELVKNNLKVNKIDKIEIVNPSPNSSSAIASIQNLEDETKQLITLKFLDDTWVQLRDLNDEIILSQLMNKNDEYTYDLSSNYSITSGNAGHILVIIDQKVVGKIGKKGQVVDSFVISTDFKN